MSVTTSAHTTAAPGLPWEYRLLSQEESVGLIRYTVECINLPHACPYCGARPKPWGTKSRVYVDIPRAAKRVEYVVVAKRMRCPSCKKTFLQELSFFNQTHGMTRRYFLDIGERCFTHTFCELGDELGLEDTSVRVLFHNFLKELQSRVLIGVPEVLALVPVVVVNRASVALVNVKAKALVDLLPEQSDKDLAQKLSDYRESGVTRMVAIGINPDYRSVLHEHLPNAAIYVDPFFVLELADAGLELTRQAVRRHLTPRERRQLAHDVVVLAKRYQELSGNDREQMNVWFGMHPVLGVAYHAREAVRAVYEAATTPAEAYAQLTQAVGKLSGQTQAHFKPLAGALREFESEIKAYFSVGAQDHPLTAIEGVRGLGDWIDAIPSRGKVFEISRATALYPARLPGLSFRTPGTSIKRLRDEALKRANG